MIFFIRFQQTKLNSYIKKVGTTKVELTNSNLKVPTPYVAKALDEVRQAYSIFNLKTKSFTGSIESFIPGTPSFTARLNYAKKLHAAYTNLKIAEKSLLDVLKKNDGEIPLINRKATKCVDITTLRKTQSAPSSPALPIVHPGLFSKSRKSSDDSVIKTGRVRLIVN
jgi:hypothetical protein